MTLHEKIISLNKVGFDVKFDSEMDSQFWRNYGTSISMRYQGIGAVKVENSKMLTCDQMDDEKFIVAVLCELYNEMKPYAIGHPTLQLEERD
jgi:hypothetical protein